MECSGYLSVFFWLLHSVSPSATHLPLNPHIHTLELCCCSCDSANCISQNPLPGGSIRFCQREAIKGNWKWNTVGRVFIPVFQLLLQYCSCSWLWLPASSALHSSFATLLRYQQQISFRRDSQGESHCAPHPQGQVMWREPPPQKSEYWPVKRGRFSELLVSDNHIASSAWFSQAFGQYLISPVLNF